MKPLVSILIPAYNAQEWIGETLKSAVGQTWSRKEIIVVDDGSRDQTLSIAGRFASKELSVVTQSNQGAAATRNKAFSLCQGDYIQWLDADDLLAPDKVQHQMEAVERGLGKRTLLSAAWASFMYRPHKAEFLPSPLWSDLSPAEWLLRKLDQNLHMQTATWLVSRELTELAGAWDTRLLGDDDGEYFCRVLLASDGVRFIPESKVFYRMAGAGSLSYIGRSARKMDAQAVSTWLHIKYLRSLEESDRVRTACLRYLQGLSFFYPERPDIIKQGEDLAVSLGGRLQTPTLSWKYDWVRKLFGWRAARYAQQLLPHAKWTLIRSWDKALSRRDQRKVAGGGKAGY